MADEDLSMCKPITKYLILRIKNISTIEGFFLGVEEPNNRTGTLVKQLRNVAVHVLHNFLCTLPLGLIRAFIPIY